MEKRILTKHPRGLQGVNIDAGKYQVVRTAIVQALRANRELTFTGLVRAVEKKLRGKFAGSITWYVITVKLDLEARKIIERVAGSQPQRIRLKKK